MELQSILALAQLTAHILHQCHTLADEFVIICYGADNGQASQSGEVSK